VYTVSDDVAVETEKWIVIGTSQEPASPQEVDGRALQVTGIVPGKTELEDTSLWLPMPAQIR
jgi:hypothetical protein